MTGGHKDRAHALLSASSAHRWLACTPSAKLETQFPDTTSEAAREGTLAHEICEVKVRGFLEKTAKGTITRRVNKLKKNDLYAAEMDHYTDEYLYFIQEAYLAFKNEPYAAIEKRVDFSNWVEGGFGTADCILIGDDTLHVIDFKYGKGVPVSPEHNPQLQLYALGAYKTYFVLFPITKIKLSIVQPRISNTSTWETDLERLLDFGVQVREKAALAIKGEGEFVPGEDQCRFCRARARCRARAEYNVVMAGFTDRKPELLTNDEIGAFLDKGEDVARWLKDLQEYALSECLAGRDVSGWKAVEGRGSRSWTDGDEAFRILIENGINEAVLYERKPLTLAQTEKTVGKKQFEELVGDYVEKKPGKPALVRESDKRPAVTNAVTAKEAFGTPE